MLFYLRVKNFETRAKELTLTKSYRSTFYYMYTFVSIIYLYYYLAKSAFCEHPPYSDLIR